MSNMESGFDLEKELEELLPPRQAVYLFMAHRGCGDK